MVSMTVLASLSQHHYASLCQELLARGTLTPKQTPWPPRYSLEILVEGEREGAEWIVRERVGAGGEMTQVLYAQMNKKNKN
jgi:hypothetical protein